VASISGYASYHAHGVLGAHQEHAGEGEGVRAWALHGLSACRLSDVLTRNTEKSHNCGTLTARVTKESRCFEHFFQRGDESVESELSLY